MRRIKTYVMTVGVALSVAPIFNSALAQQGSSSTELLLQVQSMRQEIAELRDMVERQQFQLKRLQRQAEATVNQQGGVSQGFDSRSSNYNGQSGFRPETHQGLDNTQQVGGFGQANTSTGGEFNAVEGNQTASNSAAVTQPNPQTNFDLEQAQGQAQGAYSSPSITPPVGRVGSPTSNYPPVVDRSFSTTTSSVPITGAGTQQTGTNEAQPQQTLGGQQSVRTAPQNFPDQQSANQNYQARPVPPNGGVIAIPSQVGAAQSQAASNQVAISQSPIDASQVPVQGGAATNGSSPQLNEPQVVSTQSVPATSEPSGLSEGDYYDQGFELLKQSKYEEAATIFEQQLQAHPSGDLADDAHYWIAEAMHVSRKLDVAKVHLKAIINDYPQSRRLPDAMLKTAYIEQSQGNQIEARILFQEIVSKHPQSDAAIAAKNQLAAAN